MIPRDYSLRCVVKEPTVYLADDGGHEGSQPSQGLLQVGRVVWTDGAPAHMKPGKPVLVYAEGIGRILLDPLCLQQMGEA